MGKKLQQQIVGGIFVVAMLLLFVPYFMSSPTDQPSQPAATDVPADPGLNKNPPILVVHVDPAPTKEEENDDDEASQRDPIPERVWSNAIQELGSTHTTTESTESNIVRPNHEKPAEVTTDSIIQLGPEESIASVILEENQAKGTALASEIHSGVNPAPRPDPPQRPIPVLPKIQLETATGIQRVTAAAPKTRNSDYRWFVQIGVFNHISNANAQVKRYKDAGYAVYIDQTTKQHKVRLGPYKTKQNAQVVQARLKKSNIQSTLVQLP